MEIRSEKGRANYTRLFFIAESEDKDMSEEVLLMEQWNEEHPDDCHSPWMGGCDDEYETIAPEVEEYNVDYQAPIEPQAVIEVPAEYTALSPKTGDTSIYPMVVCTIVGIITCIIGAKLLKN